MLVTETLITERLIHSGTKRPPTEILTQYLLSKYFIIMTIWSFTYENRNLTKKDLFVYLYTNLKRWTICVIHTLLGDKNMYIKFVLSNRGNHMEAYQPYIFILWLQCRVFISLNQLNMSKWQSSTIKHNYLKLDT